MWEMWAVILETISEPTAWPGHRPRSTSAIMTGDLLQCRLRWDQETVNIIYLDTCSQCDQQFCSCWESSGQVIDPFRVETSERRDMSCACARDKVRHLQNTAQVKLSQQVFFLHFSTKIETRWWIIISNLRIIIMTDSNSDRGSCNFKATQKSHLQSFKGMSNLNLRV